jgi:hypothetical protein
LFLLIFSFVFIWTKWTRWEMNNSFVPIFGCQHVNSAASTLRQKNKKETLFFFFFFFSNLLKNNRKISIDFFVCLFYSGGIPRRHETTGWPSAPQTILK